MESTRRQEPVAQLLGDAGSRVMTPRYRKFILRADSDMLRIKYEPDTIESGIIRERLAMRLQHRGASRLLHVS
jgi:hypothetical protein